MSLEPSYAESVVETESPASPSLGASAPPRLRVGIISAIRLFREGAAQLLREHEIEVVASYALDDGVVTQLSELSADIMLLDISSKAGLEILQQIAQTVPAVRLVAIGVCGSDAEVLECAQAGVAGYVTCDASFQEFLAILTSVAQGELRCLPLAAQTLRRRLAKLAGSSNILERWNTLTRREAEIVQLLEQGLSNKEIASRLFIEVSTVKTHVHNILEKLHVNRRVDAAPRLRIGSGLATRLKERMFGAEG